MSVQLSGARHWSRRLALQAIYQWLITKDSTQELLSQFKEDENWEKADPSYFSELIQGVIENCSKLQDSFSAFSAIPLDQLDLVEHAIILIAVYELINKPEVSNRIVISEAVKLCKKFGSEEGYKYVNGVLDFVSKNSVSAQDV